MNKAALKRVALSALKTFAAAAVVTLSASSFSSIHSLSDAKALVLSAAIAGGDAALKVLQVALED
jgi:hypothetical protein